MRSVDEVNTVLGMVGKGLNDCEIARLLEIPRTTVRDWRRIGPRKPRSDTSEVIDARRDALPPAAYSYLLGLYLGDGCVSKANRIWKLRVTLDTAYPGIIDSCGVAMEAVLPGQRAYVYRRKSNCVDVTMYSKSWPLLLPQHGAGLKHKRSIVLEEWQRRLLADCYEEFVRGLIHSDGCRVVANDRGNPSLRYHFKNTSADIRALYCDALDRLGIPWTHPSELDIAVYRKAATQRLDEFVGPKM